MYEEKKHLTFTIVLHALKEDDLFSGGCTSLSKLLKDMGLGYKKVNNKRYPKGSQHILLYAAWVREWVGA